MTHNTYQGDDIPGWDTPDPRTSPTTEPGELAPIREVRMPPGTQLVIALAAGGIIGAVAAWNWPW